MQFPQICVCVQKCDLISTQRPLSCCHSVLLCAVVVVLAVVVGVGIAVIKIPEFEWMSVWQAHWHSCEQQHPTAAHSPLTYENLCNLDRKFAYVALHSNAPPYTHTPAHTRIHKASAPTKMRFKNENIHVLTTSIVSFGNYLITKFDFKTAKLNSIKNGCQANRKETIKNWWKIKRQIIAPGVDFTPD